MIVIVILVPVSPSGTGNTFNSLIHSFLFSKFLADRDHVFVAVIVHLINIVAILPIGAYFSLKWWIEK